MTRTPDEESASEKFERFEDALKKVLTAPKPPPKPDKTTPRPT